VFGIYNLTDLASTVTVTIGAAGSGSASGSTPGGNGGITSFGTVIKGFGGLGGTSVSGGTGYPASPFIDSAIGSDIIAGGAGFITNYLVTQIQFNQTANQVNNASSGLSFGAAGAVGRDIVGANTKNIFGSGGAGGLNAASGSAGTGYGAGGGGGGGGGGAGAPGYCKVVVW
jgi:hypothetical protein